MHNVCYQSTIGLWGVFEISAPEKSNNLKKNTTWDLLQKGNTNLQIKATKRQTSASQSHLTTSEQVETSWLAAEGVKAMSAIPIMDENRGFAGEEPLSVTEVTLGQRASPLTYPWGLADGIYHIYCLDWKPSQKSDSELCSTRREAGRRAMP